MRKLTQEEFINRSKLQHYDKYDYSRVRYKNSDSKVIIKCHIHGFFEQIAISHLKGKGCRACGNKKQSKTKTKTNKKFIEESISVHGSTYDYSKSNYIKSNIDVDIICRTHGSFMQTPSNHLRGKGCPRCAGLNKTTDIVIEEFKKVHGDLYGYELVDYINSRTKVKIKCETHGYFIQSPEDHLNGQGCRNCGIQKIKKSRMLNPTGWSCYSWGKSAIKSKYFDSFKVYIIKCWNDNEEFYKIGRTFLETSRRFRNKNLTPYKYEVIKEIIFDNARDCINKETDLKRLNKSNKYIPLINFSGRYECFSKII